MNDSLYNNRHKNLKKDSIDPSFSAKNTNDINKNSDISKNITHKESSHIFPTLFKNQHKFDLNDYLDTNFEGDINKSHSEIFSKYFNIGQSIGQHLFQKIGQDNIDYSNFSENIKYNHDIDDNTHIKDESNIKDKPNIKDESNIKDKSNIKDDIYIKNNIKDIKIEGQNIKSIIKLLDKLDNSKQKYKIDINIRITT